MMSEKSVIDVDRGGYAFPTYNLFTEGNVHPGMTLRDYFMAHAPKMPKWFEEWRDHYTSEKAYFDWPSYYADKMIAKKFDDYNS